METKYDLKRLLRTGTLLALLLGWMLTGSFVANAQIAPMATFDVTLDIVGQGTVTVSGYANPIVGPVTGSIVGPFADGSLLTFTATAAAGWTFVGWTGTFIDPLEQTPNTLVGMSPGVAVTATFKRMLTLATFTADDKDYDGGTAATVTTWGALVGVQPGDIVTLDYTTTPYSASFDDALVGTNKTVTVNGLLLAGANAGDYQLVDPITTTANIDPATLTVGVVTTADDKEFDGNTTAEVDWTGATLSGVFGGDVVNLVTTGYTATFNNVNVGVAKPVTVTGLTLTGADAANYTLTQPSLTADITAKPITVTATVADKVYDGTTTATVTNWAISGTVTGHTTLLNTAGYVADFVDANVENGKVVDITAGVSAVNTNYTVVLPFTATGNIVAPYYAMFTPYYDVVATRPTAPVSNVAIDSPLSIEFNKAVVDINGDALPLNDLGDFVKLEWYNSVATTWDLVPFSAARVGNKITFTVLGGDLEYSELYRLRFLNVYIPNSTPAAQVIYTLDGEDRDPEVVGSLQIDNIVEFTTMSEAFATLPTVTPYGADVAVCGEVMKLTFVNPVEYLNGNQITDNPKHKFTLQSSDDNVNWTDVPAGDWSVAINVAGNPTEFTFTYTPGNFAYNKYYRVRNNVGLDANFGFVDKVTGLTLLNTATAYPHTDDPSGLTGWEWQTVTEYPVKAFVNYTTVSTEFGTRPGNLSNVTFNGGAVISYGPAPAYPLTVNNDFTADVTALPYVVASTNGEGYHVANWSRSTNGGSSWTVLPTTAPLVSPVEGQNWAPVPNFNFNPNILKPTSCAQSLAYRANFDINKYDVDVTVTGPVGSGTVAPTNANLTNLNHGTTVTLTATPAAGFYFVGWNYVGLPGTPVETVPNHTLVGYPATGANGTLSFQLVGALSHGATFDVEAVFAAWEPRIYAATDPQNAFTGLINATVQFGWPARTGFGQEGVPFTGLDFDWESYVYNTPVKLEALGADCRYEFVKWQKWNPAILPAGAWVDYPQPQETAFVNITENMRLKAVYKLVDDVNVSATANNMDLATVIIFTDASRTTPLTINDIAGAEFTYGDVLYITSYPEPDYFTWRWVDGNGDPVVMDGPPARYEDRSEWEYTVGCEGIDLKAVIDLKEYTAIVRSLDRDEGTINASLPAFNAALGNQGGLGFVFANDGAGRKGEGFFQRNSTVTFTATPAANFAFSHWETPGGVILDGNPYIIPAIHADVELIAVFVSTLPPPPTYTLNVVNNPVVGGTTSVTTDEYEEADPVSVTATAAPGYTFTGWTATGITLTVGQASSNPVNFAMPANAVTLTANYELTEYTVTPISRTYLRPAATLPATATVVDWGGSVTRTPAAGTFTAGETVALTATPNPGFRFVNWMVGEIQAGEVLRGVQVSDQQNFTYEVPAVLGNPTMFVYAIFVEIAVPEYPIYTLEVETNPVGFGTVTGAADFAHSVQAVVTQEVTEPGYQFVGWTGSVQSAGLLDYVYMTGDQTVVANYDVITYNLNVWTNNPAFGTTTQAELTFNVESLPIGVSALPALETCTHSYEFAGWFTDVAMTIPLLDNGGNIVTDESFNFIPYALPVGEFDVDIYAKFVQSVNTYELTTATALDTPANLDNAVGTTSISVAGPYTHGQTVVISTMPNAGYEFQYWTDPTGVLYIDQLTFNYEVDCDDFDFVAVYEAIEYNVTATATAGGTVAPAAQVKTIGQAVEVTATANTGFEFTGWVATGVVLADAMANPATFNMPTNDVSLEAQFTAIDYDVTATAGMGGTVAPAAQTVNYQDAITVTATPSAGYLFDGWDATGVVLANNMDNPASFSMPANDVTLHANFVAIPYVVSLTAAPANGGTFSAINATYTVGEAVSVTATANPGFEFVSWSGAPAGAVITGSTVEFNMPAGNVALTATFVASSNKLMGTVAYFNQFASKIPASANVKVALYEGAVMVGGPVTVGASGDFEFTGIVPATNYTVKVWEDANVANSWSYNNWGGVNATDALVISYMIAQNTTVENFAWIAPVTATALTDFAVATADVSNDGSLTSADPLIAMRRAIGMPGYAPYPGGAANFQVAGGADYPQAPGTVFTANGVYAAGTMAGDFFYTADVVGAAGETTFNIYFVATGDINASYVPQAGAKAQMALNYNEVINVAVGDEVRIPVRIDQASQLGAVTMGLNFNNSLLEVVSVEGFESYSIDNVNGTIQLAWMDLNAKNVAANETIVVVNARVLAPITSSTEFFMLDGTTELVDAMAKPINVSFTTVAIETGAASINEASDLVSSAYPNPFNNEATIAYTLPEAGKVNVVVYNKLGQQVVSLVNEAQLAGQHTVRLNGNDLNGNGAYFYKVTVEGAAKTYTVNGTLILVK